MTFANGYVDENPVTTEPEPDFRSLCEIFKRKLMPSTYSYDWPEGAHFFDTQFEASVLEWKTAPLVNHPGSEVEISGAVQPLELANATHETLSFPMNNIEDINFDSNWDVMQPFTAVSGPAWGLPDATLGTLAPLINTNDDNNTFTPISGPFNPWGYPDATLETLPDFNTNDNNNNNNNYTTDMESLTATCMEGFAATDMESFTVPDHAVVAPSMDNAPEFICTVEGCLCDGERFFHDLFQQPDAPVQGPNEDMSWLEDNIMMPTEMMEMELETEESSGELPGYKD